MVLEVERLVERPQANEFLERFPSHDAVRVAQVLELVGEKRVDPCPRVHVDEAAHEVGTAKGEFLPDARAHAHEPDDVHAAPAEMVQELGDVLRIERHRRLDRGVVAGRS